MLIGNAGLGKTHAALAIAGLVLEQGHDVIYVSSPDFFGKIEASRFDPSGDADTLLRTASTADLLILDEVLGLVDQEVISREEFIRFLQSADDETDLIMTGRVCPDEIRQYADQISYVENL